MHTEILHARSTVTAVVTGCIEDSARALLHLEVQHSNILRGLKCSGLWFKELWLIYHIESRQHTFQWQGEMVIEVKRSHVTTYNFITA